MRLVTRSFITYVRAPIPFMQYVFSIIVQSLLLTNIYVISIQITASIMYVSMFKIIYDQAYENQPCEHKLHRVIFLLISFILNTLSHFCMLQKKAH